MDAPTYTVEVRGKLVYHYVVLANNGQVVLTSETYFSKSNAKRAANKAAAAFGWDVK
jgi:uncharacterized protein YegP (UPF0339 family)